MSGASVVPYTQQKKAPAKPAIDAVNDSVPPLDFSFFNLLAVQDVCEEEPRQTCSKKAVASPRDPKDKKKSKSRGIRINNNGLTDIKLLNSVSEQLFSNPSSLGWIDLSFNYLTTIDPVLCEFENLEILYLHGNNITKIQEVDKLGSLKNIRKLTLHGNPLEEVKGYKQYVLSMVPRLLCLDFIRITKADMKTAETWNKMINKNSKKKKKDDTD